MSIRDDRKEYLEYMRKYNFEHRNKLREQNRQWKLEHKKQVKEYLKNWNKENAYKVSETNSQTIKRNKEFIRKLKEITPCFDCNTIYPPVCMDFDHIDSSTKYGNISQMAQRHMSLDIIKLEISKCQLVCANCHRIRTLSRGQFKWS